MAKLEEVVQLQAAIKAPEEEDVPNPLAFEAAASLAVLRSASAAAPSAVPCTANRGRSNEDRSSAGHKNL